MPRWTLAFIVFVIRAQRVNDRARFLSRGGIVKIDEWAAMNLLVEDGEVGARS
jgi:hypothetical protein